MITTVNPQLSRQPSDRFPPSKGDFRFFDPEARGIKPDLIKSTISLLVTI